MTGHPPTERETGGARFWTPLGPPCLLPAPPSPSLPRTREAMEAVATLLAQSRKACGMLKWPSGIQPKTTAAMDARKPTTVACTWGGEP